MIKSYKKKDGSNWWLFKAYLGRNPVTNKKIYTTRRGFKTKKDASLAMSRLKVETDNNGLSSKNSMTFKDLSKLWMETYKATVKSSTYSRTEIIMNKHILPYFGEHDVQKINTAFCQKIVTYWSENNAPKRFPLFVNYLRKVFKLGINMGIIQHNPADNVIVPIKKEVKEEKKLKFYTKEELQKFLNEIEAEKNNYFRTRDYTLFRLLAFSGCRIGEIVALDWSDINFKTNELSISKTVTKSDHYYISQTPKTRKSNRKVVLDNKTVTQLKKWKLEQRKFLLAHGFNHANFIFTNDHNQFTVNQGVTERYKIYRDRAKLQDIGLHGFRHTHASLLFSSGADYKDVQERLGHANIKTTMDTYTHLTDDRRAETTDLLSKYTNF